MQAPAIPAPSHTWRQSLVELVDDVYAGGANAPVGAIGQLFATVDRLSAAQARECDIALVQRMAVDVYRLHDLVRETGRTSGDAARLRRDLRRTMLEWLADQPVVAFA